MCLLNKAPQLMVMLVACLLTACQSTLKTADITQDEENLSVAPVAEAEADRETLRLQQCHQTLDALRTIQPAHYNQTFEHLMKGAAHYASLRAHINSEAQETIDALYRYRVNKLCAQIDQAILLGLVQQGESVQ